jgi:hypothetical protein
MMMALVLVGSCYPAKAGLLGIPHPPHAATKDKHARSEQSGIVRTSSPGTQGQGGGPTATSEKQVLLKSGSSPYSPQHAVGKPMLGKVGVHPWAMPTAGAAVSSTAARRGRTPSFINRPTIPLPSTSGQGPVTTLAKRQVVLQKKRPTPVGTIQAAGEIARGKFISRLLVFEERESFVVQAFHLQRGIES